MTETRLERIRRWLTEATARRVAIDLRALAAFRVALALLLLVNLLTRARFLRTFYTDAGVLPRSVLLSTHGGATQVFASVPDPWGPILLFPVAGVFALALLVGYRTRIAAAASLVLLVLLHLRNPLVLNSGDVLFRSLLLWALFLPLDRRWAIDARRYDTTRGTVSTLASAAVLIQVVVVYSVNAVHKLHSHAWLSGQAVPQIFQADQLTYLLGDVLATHPTVLVLVTYLWLGLVIVAPLLVVLTGRKRAGFVSLFVAMHAGMAPTMSIGLFPYVSITGLLLLYPPVVWDAAERFVSGTSVSETIHAWAARVERAVALSRRLLAERPRLAHTSRVGRTVVVALVLALVVLSAGSTVARQDLPGPVEQTLDTTNLAQHWQMFAPHPRRTTRWFAFPANRTDGTLVDALHGGRADLGRPPDAVDTYPSNRWRKYFQSVQAGAGGRYRRAFGAYLCRHWNRTHPRAIEDVSIYVGYERTDPDTGAVQASGGRYLFRYECGS